MEEDIRWQQRFSNFIKTLNKLSQTVEHIRLNFPDDDSEGNKEESNDVLDEIVKQGLIQSFEYTHELAWNVMKDYATYQGNSTIGGSRDATREGFQLQLVTDGKTWMNMIGSRNKTSHTYHQATADEIYTKIMDQYYPAFLEFKNMMEFKRSEEQGKFL